MRGSPEARSLTASPPEHGGQGLGRRALDTGQDGVQVLRPLDVVRLVALGRTNAEIAAWAWQNGHARAGA
ncbi:hypothetical protein OG542_05240 [Streptomyces violaceus]|uniref:hypothetical protein n=1 Tax=Streptomyces violaceus TaxID=1936 RepID=UPI002E1AC927